MTLNLPTIAIRAQDFDVAAGQLRRFEDRLAAAAAWGDDLLAIECAGLDSPAGDRNPGDIPKAEGQLGGIEKQQIEDGDRDRTRMAARSP